MSKFLQSTIADTPLVRNFETPHYLELLLDRQPTSEACLAQFDMKELRQELENARNEPDRVPSQICRLIAAPTFFGTLCGFFHEPLAETT